MAGHPKKRKGKGCGSEGRTTELIVGSIALAGFTEVKPEAFCGSLFDRCFCQRLPYKNIWFNETIKHSDSKPSVHFCHHEYAIKNGSDTWIVECKHQDNGGSVDEKLTYILLSFKECQISDNWIVVFNGLQWLTKARARGGIDWLKREAGKLKPKRLVVCTGIEEWYTFAQREFME